MNPAILGPVVAMLIGVLGTSVIHLSKGLMRHGIASGSRVAYSAGVLMNFTNPLWVILANRFAPTVFYTSMYGLGLLTLLLFSRAVLGEHLERRQYRGISVIVLGTLLIGLGNLLGGKPSLYGADRMVLLSFAGVWVVGAPVISRLIRRKAVRVQEYVFGIAAGGLAALEAVVKGVAQAGPAGSTFLPQSSSAWWLFGASFLGAAGAFGMIQWSYFRRCRASMMGSLYDVAYVTVPLLLTAILVEDAGLGAWSIAGTVCVSLGVMETVQQRRVEVKEWKVSKS
jgi:multidrug transporter EmrE-like cation transporter